VLNSEISISGKIAKNAGKFYVGKDPWNFGIKGKIAEPLFFLNEISPETVMDLYNYGIENY
jgi:hypothetical protein